MVKFVGIAPLRRAACSPITSDSELERLEFQFYKLKWLILGRKYTNYLPKSAIFLWQYTFREYTCSEKHATRGLLAGGARHEYHRVTK